MTYLERKIQSTTRWNFEHKNDRCMTMQVSKWSFISVVLSRKILKEEVKELRKITATESCPHLIKQGVTSGEDVYLDPDGVNHGKKAAVIDNDIFIPLLFLDWILFSVFIL